MASCANVDEYRGVWVFIEQTDGEIARVSLELISKGRELADKLHVPLSAILLGHSVGDLSQHLIYYGVDCVLLADDPILKHYRTETYVEVICRQVNERKPEVVIIGATPIGRDLAPRLSFRLSSGCTADCTHLDIDEEERLFVSTRPAFGGNVMATIICPDRRPQMSTVRPGVMPLPKPDASRYGEIIHIDVNVYENDVKVKIRDIYKDESMDNSIQDAERIVAIGKGAGDRDTFELIKTLAQPLDAAVAGSRLAVEAGWISHDYQIGQTGKTVRPSLYIGCGISGAVQHTAGMSDSKTIVAINSDDRAELFKIADYGIVGDVKKIVPAIIEKLESLKSCVE